MKKLILVLAILAIATPAFATVAVDLVKIAGVNEVNIVYSSNGDGSELPRAFALVVTSEANLAIVDVNGFKIGESSSTSKGYGIYPATIVIDSCGVVTSNGTPIADGNDPLPSGSDQILPSQKLVLEFGSLYPAADHNKAPDPCGTLARLKINCTGSVGDYNVTVTPEATYRGGVVLENGSAVSVGKTLKYTCASADCLTVGQVFSTCTPVVNLTVNAAMITKWNYLGKPKCWCCNGQKCGNGIYTGGSLNRADTADLGDLKLSWFKSHTQPGYKPCSDYNLSGRVDTADFGILKLHWFKTVGSSGCL